MILRILIFVFWAQLLHCDQVADLAKLKSELASVLAKLDSFQINTQSYDEVEQVNQSSIARYWHSIIKCYIAARNEFRNIGSNWSSLIDLHQILHTITIIFLGIALFSFFIRALILIGLERIKLNSHAAFVLNLLIKNIDNSIFVLSPYWIHVVWKYQHISGFAKSHLVKTMLFARCLKCLADIALLLMINRSIVSTTNHLFGKESKIIQTANTFITLILSVKVLKVIASLILGNVPKTESFVNDLNYIETVTAVFIITFMIFRIRNFINLAQVHFLTLLRYTGLPIIIMGIIAYTLNSHGAQFIYRIVLTLLVWPAIYQLHKLIRTTTYIYLKQLPPYGRSTAIEIYVITNNMLRYAVVPLSIVVIAAIFSINLLEEVRAFIGASLTFKISISLIALMVIRISLIVNVYLCKVYAGRNINIRPFDKQRIATSAIIMEKFFATVIFIISTVLFLLIFGFETAPLFQSVGLFSAAMSLSLQNVIRDIVNGIFILYENSIRIGELIDYESQTAIVEDMSLRFMRIRLDDGLLVTIPFHKLDIIKNKSKQFSYIVFNISIDRQTDIVVAEAALDEAFKNVRDKPEFRYKILKDIEMGDLADLTSFSYVIQCRVCVQPNSQYKIRRALNREIKVVFEKYQILIATPMVANATNVPSLNTGTPYPDFQ